MFWGKYTGIAQSVSYSKEIGAFKGLGDKDLVNRSSVAQLEQKIYIYSVRLVEASL